MTAKQTLQPKLRFPEFDGDWHIDTLGKLFNVSAGGDIKREFVSENRNDIFKYPIYANAEKNKGFYGYASIYKIDEEVITIAGRGVNIGIAHARKEKFYPIVRLLVLKPKKKVSVDFFEYAINKFDIVVESTGVPQLTAPQISNYEINYTNLEEQTKIANFLSSIDEKINLLKEKKALLEAYKKGMMQKIFNQEIRFKDDNGNDFEDWKSIELGEVLNYIQPTKYIVKSTDYSDDYETPVLTAGKTFILGYTDETDNIYKEKLPVIIFDDFTTANKFVDFPFKVKSSAMKILICNNKNVDIKYIYEFIQTLNFGTGDEHKRYWISEYSKCEIDLPCLKEQTKIANFLSAIDEKIDLMATQIKDTQEYKKGLLQQMFV